MIDMTKKLNIAIVGLGQIGNYLYNELNTKKKDILKKLEKLSLFLQFQLKILIKKENLELIKKYFTKILLKSLKIIKLIF